MSCFSHAFQSVHCCLVATYWERADLLALVGNDYCICYFPLWYPGPGVVFDCILPDLCCLSYFYWSEGSGVSASLA